MHRKQLARMLFMIMVMISLHNCHLFSKVKPDHPTWNFNTHRLSQPHTAELPSSCSVFFPVAFVCATLLQSCPTLCNPMDCSSTGSSVHGILQARILEWVAMPSSRGSSQRRDQTQVSWISCNSCRFFTTSPTWEAHGTYHSNTLLTINQ